ncbi:MAG: DNA polymerase III subunit delta [candidate division Zixibacteria bacterium]|nr:DNA polymerase III subunit delta [candidate division Zixibacteria bacterium]
MKPSELIKELEAGRFRPVYYFFGDEEYRIKEAEKTLTKMFLGSRSPASNHVVLSASKTKTVDILTELSVIPMMGDRQVFTISDVQSLTPGDAEKVITMLDPPDPNRVVILTSPVTKTPRKKTKMYTLLTEKTASVEFGRLTGNMSERKVRFMLQERHIEIDPDAMEILVRMGGGNMGGLIAEVNKLIDYVGEGGRITREEIVLVSSDYQAFEIYELAETIAAREIDRALAILGFLLRKGERASSLLFWIGEHFIGVYLTRNGKPVRMGNRDMSWKYRKHVNLFTNEQLEHIIELAAQADLDLRSNIKPERVILEKLIIGILAENDRKSPHEQKNRGRKTGF